MIILPIVTIYSQIWLFKICYCEMMIFLRHINKVPLLMKIAFWYPIYKANQVDVIYNL